MFNVQVMYPDNNNISYKIKWTFLYGFSKKKKAYRNLDSVFLNQKKCLKLVTWVSNFISRKFNLIKT